MAVGDDLRQEAEQATREEGALKHATSEHDKFLRTEAKHEKELQEGAEAFLRSFVDFEQGSHLAWQPAQGDACAAGFFHFRQAVVKN